MNPMDNTNIVQKFLELYAKLMGDLEPEKRNGENMGGARE